MKHLLLCVLIFLSYLTAIAGQDQVLRQKAARAEKYRSYPEVVLIDSTAVTVASTGSGSFTANVCWTFCCPPRAGSVLTSAGYAGMSGIRCLFSWNLHRVFPAVSGTSGVKT